MRPNIILITTDQQRKDSMGCYGSTNARTPHLDQLAAEGVVFHRGYCTSPVCTPSRASIYSGKYASKHGAWNVGTAIPESESLLSHRLAEAGYRTHHIGKAHFQPYLASPDQSRESILDGWKSNFDSFNGPYYGFQTVELAMGHSLYGGCGHYGLWLQQQAGRRTFEAERKSSLGFGGEAYNWHMEASLHNSSWTAERAAQFITQYPAQAEEPFFLSIGFQDPHHPHAVPQERAQAIHSEHLTPPDYDEGELLDKPPHFLAVHKGEWNRECPLHGQFAMAGQSSDGYDYRLVNDQDALTAKSYYYTMVEMIDDGVGKVIEALRSAGLAHNTIIIYTSDHGELLGDHGIWMKGPFHYEPLVNVPLIFHGPAYFQASHNEAIVSLVDLVPTLLKLCHMPIPSDLNGVDISHLLYGQAAEAREAAIVEYVDDPYKLRLKTVVSKQFKLTVYYGEYGKQAGELYDLIQDPSEKVNLWNHSEFQSIQLEMLYLLVQELEKLENREARTVYA